jgi:hypothetical protein
MYDRQNVLSAANSIIVQTWNHNSTGRGYPGWAVRVEPLRCESLLARITIRSRTSDSGDQI